MRHSIFYLILTAIILSPFSAYAGLTSMREPLFGDADQARAQAEALDAKLLAPVSHSEAMDNYNRADAAFDRAGSVDTIRRYLAKAQAKFRKSAEAAEIARVALDTTIQARNDALASEAFDFASDEWDSGESNFAQATRRLERGSIGSAERHAEKAEAAYRDGELIAIKANYLNETRHLISQAEKLRAERYSPMSLNNARLLLESAEKELNTNRYDTDRPRSLAADAKHNALHAIYVAKLERQIRDRETNLEAVLLQWEASIARLGDELDTPVYFDRGETEAIEVLLNEVTRIRSLEASLTQQLSDRDAELASLEMQSTKMQELLGGGNQTIEEMEVLLSLQERRLEQQARHRERFATVESLFDAEEATVLRQGDTVIIRLIGLNFDSGYSKLNTEHLQILDTLEQAISEFPESQVVVEGHTDAFGSDAQNLDLSQARADSVVKHLLATLPISPANLDARGYGESRPVANNETAEGRKRNRRIDVVIEPGWVTQAAIAQAEVFEVSPRLGR